MKKAIIFYKDSLLNCATSKNFLSLIFELVLFSNRSYKITINKKEFA